MEQQAAKAAAALIVAVEAVAAEVAGPHSEMPRQACLSTVIGLVWASNHALLP